MMLKCEEFSKSYKPTYVIGRDTLIVSRFTQPPEDINSFLFNCIRNNDFRPLKYCCMIIIKQNLEYYKVNHDDYMLLDEWRYSKNGFLELIRIKMGIPLDTVTMTYIPFYTGEICTWIHEHKKEIIDYDDIARYLEKK